MTLDTPTMPTAPSEAPAQRGLWAALTRWRQPAAVGVEADVGYESALPWTQGMELPSDRVGRRSAY